MAERGAAAPFGPRSGPLLRRLWAPLLASLTLLALLLSSCADEPCLGPDRIWADLTIVGGDVFLRDGEPIAGARLCLVEPGGCPCVRADARGRALLPLPVDAPVSVRISAPGHLGLALQVMTEREDLGGRLSLPNDTLVAIFAGLSGVAYDASMGHLGLAPDPVPGGDLSGARYELLRFDGSPVTGADGGPLPALYSQTHPLTANETEASGQAIFGNIPPGRYLLRSELIARCSVVGGWDPELFDLPPDPSTRALEIFAGSATNVVMSGCR